MVSKFPDNSVVMCNICETNFKWANVESGMAHVQSRDHASAEVKYAGKHGMIPPMFDMFKKSFGNFIEPVKFQTRPN